MERVLERGVGTYTETKNDMSKIRTVIEGT